MSFTEAELRLLRISDRAGSYRSKARNVGGPVGRQPQPITDDQVAKIKAMVADGLSWSQISQRMRMCEVRIRREMGAPAKLLRMHDQTGRFHLAPEAIAAPSLLPPRPEQPNEAPPSLISLVAAVVGDENAERVALALERARWNRVRRVWADVLWFDRSGRGAWVEVPT